MSDNENIDFGNRTIKANRDAVEPKEYFKILKGKKQQQNGKSLTEQLEKIAELILKAKEIGQTGFLEKLVFTHETIIKEQTLLSEGIEQFVYKDDIKFFLDKIHPKNSIKIVELERYPRGIPIDVMDKVKKVQDLDLFDEYVIVFTDFTGVKIETEQEKKFVQKNKDPIVFGFFKHEQTGLKHDRFYYIADWEDEDCDLTFTKMIEKMKKVDTMGEKPDKKISTDQEYLNEIINGTLENMKKSGRYGKIVEPEIKNETFWSKYWPFKKNQK